MFKYFKLHILNCKMQKYLGGLDPLPRGAGEPGSEASRWKSP